jgi:dipeptidyl aminopeptidase/acylaminoacyl peptidase
VVDFFGPADLVSIASEKSVIPHAKADSPESRLIGGAILDNVEKAKAASPVTYATNGPAPFLIVHGDQDQLVPWQQSELLYEALTRAGADVTFYTIAGAGHEDPRFDSPMMRAAVKAFFDKHLRAVNGE